MNSLLSVSLTWGKKGWEKQSRPCWRNLQNQMTWPSKSIPLQHKAGEPALEWNKASECGCRFLQVLFMGLQMVQPVFIPSTEIDFRSPFPMEGYYSAQIHGGGPRPSQKYCDRLWWSPRKSSPSFGRGLGVGWGWVGGMGGWEGEGKRAWYVKWFFLNEQSKWIKTKYLQVFIPSWLFFIFSMFFISNLATFLSSVSLSLMWKFIYELIENIKWSTNI